MLDLKWSITVGKKRRGKWRPPITIQIWNEGDCSNPLNIDRKFTILFPLMRSECVNKGCTRCTKGELINKFKLKPFPLFLGREEKEDEPLNHCGYKTPSYFLTEIDFFETWAKKVYPEWRPGIPDYTDYVKALMEFICRPAIEEYERRMAEAMDSAETEEYIVTSDQFEVQKQQEEVKIARKLRIVT